MVNNTTIVPRLIKPKQAAEYLAVSPRKLWSMTRSGAIDALRLGRSVRYDLRDLDDFISQAKSGGTIV